MIKYFTLKKTDELNKKQEDEIKKAKLLKYIPDEDSPAYTYEQLLKMLNSSPVHHKKRIKNEKNEITETEE